MTRPLEAKPAGFDFILSDFAMPGLDGLAIINRLKPLCANTQMALMTGNADDPRLSDDHFISVVRKPLRLEALQEVFAEGR